MPGLIPQRPKTGKFDLKPEEMDGLSYYVLSGCTREAAFLKFMRPDFLGSKATSVIKNTVSQFFAMKDVKNYLEAYKQTIEELLNPKQARPEQLGNIEERKARAKTKLVEFAMSLADHIEDAEDPETVLKLADKVGLLDQEEQVDERPRRYLPVSCQSGCAYRMFCEENTEDMCQYCKYHAYGEKNGVHFEKTEILDAPVANSE
jgi:hypothetical protein